MSADIIPLNQPDPLPVGEWQAIEVIVPERLPRIPAGEYEAVSVGLKKYEAFKRQVLRLEFDVFKGAATDGEILGRLAYYMRWTGKKPAPTSKLGRLLQVAQIAPGRGGRPRNLAILQHKLWRVRVADAKKDSEGRELAGDTVYSVIIQILERLA